jgi:hypothetical protein
MTWLTEALNEPEITSPSLSRWIDQFDAGDQPIDLRLLECMQLPIWARLIRECRLLHERLCIELAEDGIVLQGCSDIDFTRAFRARAAN